VTDNNCWFNKKCSCRQARARCCHSKLLKVIRIYHHHHHLFCSNKNRV